MNKRVADRPLTIKLPNGNTVRSSHVGELDLPLIPSGGRVAHVVPGLASHSFVSTVKLCNARCQVDMRDISCEIRYRGQIIVRCSKDTRTGLWMMPLTQQNNKEILGATTSASNWASSVHHWKEMQTATTSEIGWSSFVRQHKEAPNDQYDSRWRKLPDK